MDAQMMFADLGEATETGIVVFNRDVATPKNWGITLKAINGIGYGQLETLFYGTRNLIVPDTMLTIMSGMEVLSKYYAAGSLKRYNDHLDRLDLPRDFFGLVERMDMEADRNIRVPIRFRIGFPASSYELRERFGGLSEGDRAAFVTSFFSKYVPSLREEPSNPEAFYDPNCDGHNKEIYAKRILDFLKGRWEASR